MPGNKFIIYDAGYKTKAKEEIEAFIPAGAEIELLVLSHTDADHWGAADFILNRHKVKKILKTDFRANKLTDTYKKGIAAIKPETKLLDLKKLKPGDTLYFANGVVVHFISG